VLACERKVRRLWRDFLRLFFRLLYNELAWTYDLVAWMVSLGQWNAWGRVAIPYLVPHQRPRDGQVLELAHGPGHLLMAMARHGLNPVGLDLSSHMGRLARRRLKKAGRPSIPLVRGRAQALPFPDSYFERVVAAFPTDFILDPFTLREVARVLRPRGRLVVVAWVWVGGRDLFSRFLRWLYRVTGQGEPLPSGSEAIVTQVGFVPCIEWVRVGCSEVMVVVAERQ
jgi:ubiquinone/menaquinone biosynthesis C-methylase UbiE